MAPEDLAQMASANGSIGIAYTYTDLIVEIIIGGNSL